MNRHALLLHDRQGFSLIETLIVLGIMSIIMSAMIMLQVNQHKEVQSLNEKLATSDLKRVLIAGLADGSICSTELATTAFNPSGPHKINTDDLASQKLTFTKLHASSAPTAPSLIEVGEPVSPTSERPIISAITFENFKTTGLADSYFVDLKISLQGGMRALAPIVMPMQIETDPATPSSAKAIKGCTEVGKAGKAYRLVFTTNTTWEVPPGVKSAFVTMAGGGGSGFGWRIVNMLHSGHSGGYIFSHPVALTPGEVITIEIGKGATGYGPFSTGVLADPGPPYYIYTSPAGDDGLGGYPGTSSKMISPSKGILLECSGGSGASASNIDTFTGPVVAGNVQGATTGSGNGPFAAPSRPATGAYATPAGPGACGPDSYGIGNPGAPLWDVSSGYFPGGLTPLGYGSGGPVSRYGCHVNGSTVGTCTFPHNGRDGVVIIDVWY